MDEEEKNDIKTLQKDLTRVTDEVKQFAEDVTKRVTDGLAVSEKLKEQTDKALAEQGEFRARIDELEQKAARRAEQRVAQEHKTPGQLFVEHGDVIKFCAERQTKGRVRVGMASLQAAITSLPGSGAALVEPMRVPGIVALPERRMTVRDLLTPGRTSQNAIQFVQESGFTNNADVVSEGVRKPQSAITFDLVTKSVATIAHWIPASKQILDDAPMLQSHIDGRLRYGLAYVEEQQLLNGDGTGSNLDGIVPNATAFNPAFTLSGQTRIDTIRLAILQSELAEFPSTGIVLNPIDWTHIELTKDSEGRYIFAQPQGMAGPVLWGRPVVPTQAMTSSEFLTGAFRLGAQVFDREDANVEISTEDGDNFTKNLVTIRAEERLVLAIYRGEAFVTGDFDEAS